MIILSGTSNEPLAHAIADRLSLPLGDVEITRFIDNECRVYVKEYVTDTDVFVVQSLSMIADQHLIELCLLGQALKDLHAKSVTAVIPWMGYSKQDKAFRKGEAISAQLVAKLIEAAGFDRVITCELHSETVVPYFHIPVTELSTHQVLLSALPGKSKLTPDSAVVVSPDKGGKSRSELFAKEAGLPVVYLAKARDIESGAVTVTGIEGDVRGKTVVIFDDIINTGATAVTAARFLMSHGAGSVLFLATHGVLAGDAADVISRSEIGPVVVSDTIYIPESKRFPRLTVASVATLFADAIAAATK
jgi:ribose-phosphate pyrophosphokinase